MLHENVTVIVEKVATVTTRDEKLK